MTMVESAAWTTNRPEEAWTTMKLRLQQVLNEEKEEDIIIPRALQWIMAATSSSPPTLTIEEANRKTGMPRGGFWLAAVYMPCLFIGVTSLLAYELYRKDHLFPRSGVLWRPAAIVVWGVFMALVTELPYFMSLFLPRAPDALRDAAVYGGIACVGYPLAFIVVGAACIGHTWMGVALACVFALLFAAVIALWVWLVRTYAKL